MSEKIIDGKKISLEILEEVKNEAMLLKEKNIVPGLAFILVGEDPASKVYVSSKAKACEAAGFYSVTERLEENVSENELIELIDKFNKDNKIHGILVQLPLPKGIDENKIIQAIDPAKDVDGFHPVNLGKLVAGLKGFIPCTPAGIVELIKRTGIETSGKNVTVIGRSNIVGKPAANLFLQKDINSTVTVCHSGTKNLNEFTQKADILIAAIGKADFVKKEMIKEGCTIIDVGINRVEDKTKKSGYRITGDVDFQDCIDKCSHITPVPGGVGPMTIAMLMRNTLESAKNLLRNENE
ncbi:bifunctional methylenetetrahydrofolate dehydrogenase/methenyltetrahydrofolate cyclohydrolase FolD [soil metagenome]